MRLFIYNHGKHPLSHRTTIHISIQKSRDIAFFTNSESTYSLARLDGSNRACGTRPESGLHKPILTCFHKYDNFIIVSIIWAQQKNAKVCLLYPDLDLFPHAWLFRHCFNFLFKNISFLFELGHKQFNLKKGNFIRKVNFLSFWRSNLSVSFLK